ncbi:MAG TPA: hypothetical protein ENK54_01925 [Thiotrichales bacterium]|nr:hypothetical protein [Thiotrichales bacterium]
MSLSTGEFLRALAALGQVGEGAEGEFSLVWPPGRVILRVTPLEPLRAGALSLPRVQVTIEPQGLDADAESRFHAAFDRAFQRGGG